MLKTQTWAQSGFIRRNISFGKQQAKQGTGGKTGKIEQAGKFGSYE